MGTTRVMIVEGESGALCALVAGLKEQFTVLGLRSPDEALSASPELYDAILVDVPGNGAEELAFARQLQARLITTPIIFMGTDRSVALAARLADAFAFVPKPPGRKELTRVLDLAAHAIGTTSAASTVP